MSDITRRDFINGTLMATGGALLPLEASGQAAMAALDPSYYPPALTGMRGSHPGSNDHAHARAWAGRSDWGPTTKVPEKYDLIIVGGGLSGLSAARFYQQKHGADKKILILDNHDDFGGHAKRNEHVINGKLRIGYGGSQTIVEPRHASKVVLSLFKDIGVDLKGFETAFDREFFKRHDLGSVTYFNKEVFGDDKVVQHPFCNYPNYIEGLLAAKLSNEEAVKQTPLSAKGKEQLLRVLEGGIHKIPKAKRKKYLEQAWYFDYLKEILKVDDPLILRMARHSGLDWATTGTDLMGIQGAKGCGALGFKPKAVYDEDNPYIYHFPDGNAGVARALVKKLVPTVAAGNNAEELVLARFKYPELDKAANAVRIRLNSTVVNVKHGGDPKDAEEVFVTYINDNKSYQVTGKAVVMACYNMIIPHIVSGLPGEQSAALRKQLKCPLQYTTVGLTNWRAFKQLGIGLAMSPGNMHQAVLMDFPVSMGGYAFTKSPDEPCIIQMISCPYGTEGKPAEEQYKEARYKMLALQFKDYEAEVRRHLTGMLGSAAFDFDKDVAGISVNRWAHGYTVGGGGNSTRIGRQKFGRITIANCDSAPGADAKTAIMMGHRAVSELG
jgi:spermidine dehydrogenase